MNYDEFMIKVQDYYGPYNSGNKIGQYVKSYLKQEIDDTKLQILFRYVTYSHPVNYGPPDIAGIERAITNGIKNRNGTDPRKKRPTYDIIIEKEELTDAEYEEGQRLLQEAGGLDKMMRDLLSGKKVRFE